MNLTQPSPELSAHYTQLTNELREIATLASVAAMLAWDQETMMPPRGAELRADQLALVAGLVHERRTNPRIAGWLGECEADPALLDDERIAANLRELRRQYERAVRLPASLVREIAQTTSLAIQAWKDARERGDFPAFEPWLGRVVTLSRARAECYGAQTGAEMYDVLMEDYEPHTRSADVDRLFASLRERLTPLIAAILDSPTQPDHEPNRTEVPIPLQQELNHLVLERIGFTAEAGRIDTSTHPFCEGIGPGDTRLTTRYRSNGFLDALSSTMHEAGHGLYEQGLPKAEFFGQPLGESVSFGIHESQSRLWENMVGRSLPFWQWAFPTARDVFGTSLEQFDAQALYRAANIVRPGQIRVDSDEATYNLHIMLRYDLERALVAGDLAIPDIPGVWNERMRTDLGVTVTDDRQGCLQDIHWAMGGIGYFPTYTLGNLYAAQLWAAIRDALPDLDNRICEGDFTPLLHWLRENVHRHGNRFTAAELCERATGKPLGIEPLVTYLEGKLKPIYGL